MRNSRPVLIGREPELGVIDDALLSGRCGGGRAVFLVGEGGIGRSRLVAAAADRAAAAGMPVMRGRGSLFGPAVPLRPLTEAVLSFLRSADKPDIDSLGPYRAALGRLVPDWADAGQEVPDSPVILGEALLRLAAAAGGGTGCLIALDDLQDADPETLAVVEYMTDNVHAYPAVLLCAVRDEPGPALDLLHATQRRYACIPVYPSPLTRAGVAALAEHLLGDPQRLTEATLESVWLNGAGNPMVTEELLRMVCEGGDPPPAGGSWSQPIRPAVARMAVQRLRRLSPHASTLLSAAAVFGARFPLAISRAVTGLDPEHADREIRAAVELNVIRPDLTNPGWYEFTQPYVAAALTAEQSPAARVELAALAANETEAQHPGLPGPWCEVAARLRMEVGDLLAAGRLLLEAGRRSVDSGDLETAVGQLDRARQLLGQDPDPAVRANAVDQLLRALVAMGEVIRAEAVANAAEWLTCSPDVRSGLHVRFGWLALAAGRYADAAGHVATAGELLGEHAPPMRRAAVDALAVHLTLDSDAEDPGRVTELARRAAELVDLAVAQPRNGNGSDVDTLCQLWHALGLTARRRDPAEATRLFTRMRRLATEFAATLPRLQAQLELARDIADRDGDAGPLRRVREEAAQAGVAAVRLQADAALALHDVLGGRYAAAGDAIEVALVDATKLGFHAAIRDLTLAQAVLTAHKGRRRELDEAMRSQPDGGSGLGRHRATLHGLSGVFVALLFEDRAQARAELGRARALGGCPGVGVLLDALDGGPVPDGAAGERRYPRWDRLFLAFAEAVRMGRAGRPEDAATAVVEAQRLGSAYPMAYHLGLRLVAEAAVRDQWGEPYVWLRRADDWFHAAEIPAVAAACRSLLRGAGEPVRQRRQGSVRVPVALRAMGITVREHDVLLLLGERLDNRSLAERLHISPRTAEKHVASLLAKTGAVSRDALRDVAVAVRLEPIGPCVGHPGGYAG